MKQRNSERDADLQALLVEYERLNRIADAVLSTVNVRSRPNWHRFHEAHKQIITLVEKLKLINGH